MLYYNPELTFRASVTALGHGSGPGAIPDSAAASAASVVGNSGTEPAPTPTRTPPGIPGIPGIRIDDSALKSNQRIVNSHVTELYDEDDIYPGAGGLSGPAAVLYVVSGAPVVVLPNAVLTAWEMEIPVRKLWGRAVGVELTFLYTGPAASTNNMVITVAGFGVAVGSVQGAIADAYATGTAIPGPAVAQTVLSFTHRSPGSLFTSASKYIIPRIVRDGANAADTYPGDLHILAVHWRIFGQ